MPSKNVLKVDIPDSYYHVYARGIGEQHIFLENADFQFFLQLFERYLSAETILSNTGTPYLKLHQHISLVCYCLMGNHFHLLLHQHQAGGMQRLMRGVMTAYSRYFNDKYQRRGPLFESRYKASRIDQAHVVPLTRYIHLIPLDWERYPDSSVHTYLKGDPPHWLQTAPVLSQFASPAAYRQYINDSAAAKEQFPILEAQLAHSP
jgi:putative transposase